MSDYDRNEWGTPESVISPIREFLGGIDLDVCSSPWHNERVKAKAYFTKYVNALQIPWEARTVYCNPPYSQPDCAGFMYLMNTHYTLKRYKEGILLVNSAPEVKAFKFLAKRYPVMFSERRIKFIHEGYGARSNRFTQALFYLGPRGFDFLTYFEGHGWYTPLGSIKVTLDHFKKEGLTV